MQAGEYVGGICRSDTRKVSENGGRGEIWGGEW